MAYLAKHSIETDKDFHGFKYDNARSCVSGLLHVLSVFDDETEIPSVIRDNIVQTWNSQYYRG